MKSTRFIAALLCLLMPASLLPAAAFADYGEDEEIICPFEETAEESIPADDKQPAEDAYVPEEDEVISEEGTLPAEDEEALPGEEEDAEEAPEDEEIPAEPETEEDVNEFEEIISGVCGAELTWKLLDTGTLIIDGKGEMYNGQLLFDHTFSWSDYRKDVTSIKIMPGATSIGAYAFNNFENLVSVSLPSSITVIGDGAFRKCSTLPNIEISKNVSSIGASAFQGCSGLAAAVLPEGLKSIGDEAFRGCGKLPEIAIPAGVTYIGAGAFRDCSLLKSAVIPAGVSEIKEYTFEDCSAMESVSIPAGVAAIGQSAFRDCSKLASVILPAELKTVSASCFFGCCALAGVKLPKNVESIETLAFSGCTSLTEIEFPAGVKSIAALAFSGSALKTIRFRGDAPAIGQSAFMGITATAFYPEGNESWTEDVRVGYGGTITWESYDATVREAPVITTVANHADYMIVCWNKVEGAVSYRIAYREGSNAWQLTDVPLTAVDSRGNPRLNFRGLTQGSTYTFIVYAVFKDGKTTKSESVAQMRLISPAVSAKVLAGYIKLSWDAVEGGSCYKIYYREQGGKWQLYTSVKNTVTTAILKLEKGKTYEVCVLSAISVPGITSGFPNTGYIITL